MIADPIGQLWIPLDKLDTTTTRFSYPTNPDYSQYLQYSKSLLQGNSRRGHEEQSPALDYRIVALTHPGVGLTITIREYAALQPSRQFSWGGSSFLVASGLSGVGCPTRDHFNGTYTAVCPPGPNRTACSRVTVTRAGRDYDLYRLKLNPTSVRVYTGHHCWSNADPTRSRARTVATWSGDSVQVASITHRYGVPIDLTRADVEICHRLRAFDHVSMMGVSHMRYAFDYVMLRCFGTEDAKWLSRKHGDCHVGNVDYKIVYYATDWRAAVRREMTEYRLTSGSLVIVQFGAYDLMTRDYRITMTESVAQFMRSVRRLCALGARVVVVATPPFPDKIADRKRRGHRNNFAVSAFNYNVWKRIVALQVCVILVLS